MELKWLEDFVSVAELRNFSKAATVRHATQPALSRRIKSLELWYGVSLIDRSTYPVTLTDAGAAFLPVAQQMVAGLYRSRRDARAESGVVARTVKFVMPHSLAVYFFPAWWRRQKRHADAKAVVVAADFDDCVELFRNGACQFMLCFQHRDFASRLDEQGTHRLMVGTDRLVPVSALGTDGRPLFDLSPDAADALPLLAYSKASFLGRVTSDLHARLESRREVMLRYESSLVEALKAEAIVGEGIAWLPESMIKSELQSGVLTIIGDEASTIPLELWLFRPSAAMRSAVSVDALALKMDDMMDTPPMSESVSYPQVKRP